jgi:hypothetical protein
MPSLSEYQRTLARSLLASSAAERAAPAHYFNSETSVAAGLKVHRNTVIGALCNALRLSYPSLHALLGLDLFDGLAADFARDNPPDSPALMNYGAAFADHVSNHIPPEQQQLVRELAQFDWLFERVAAAAPGFDGGISLPLDAGLSLTLARSLRLFSSVFPVDEIRAGLLADTATVALQYTAGTVNAECLALWRTATGVGVRKIGGRSASILSALLAGTDAASVMDAATVAEFEHDVLRSTFAQIRKSSP